MQRVAPSCNAFTTCRFFIDGADTTYKFELGGTNHEGCAGWAAVGRYCAVLTVHSCAVLPGLAAASGTCDNAQRNAQCNAQYYAPHKAAGFFCRNGEEYVAEY